MKEQIRSDMKDAMRAKDKVRLGVIRMIMAAIKQREVDERIELSNQQVLEVLDKMVKQRRESLSHYDAANREDLAAVERNEIEIVKTYLPEPLSDEEISVMINAAIIESGAESMKDMGKVMGLLRGQMQGKADMGAVSNTIKAKLAG